MPVVCALIKMTIGVVPIGAKEFVRFLSHLKCRNTPGQNFYREMLLSSDEPLEAYVRENANHIYHPAGTCKMGNDSMAVVDPALRVHGVEGLRVADISIMPTVVSGNTNAPAIMIGEKAADMILADHSASLDSQQHDVGQRSRTDRVALQDE